MVYKVTIKNMNLSYHNCMMVRNVFLQHGIDILFLQLTYGLSALMIIIANILLIRMLLRQEMNKVNILFLILSCSDLIVGTGTIPLLTSWFFTEIDERVYCKMFPIGQFFLYCPVIFSWIMTIIIAIDRYLVITKPLLHAKYMGHRALWFYVSFSFVFSFAVALWKILAVKLTANLIESTFAAFKGLVEITFIVITASLYIHLLIFVRRRARIMAGSRHEHSGQKSYSARTTKTIALVFVCLVCCNLTELCGYVYYVHLDHTLEPELLRNLVFWLLLPLLLNSFFNAVIVMSRSAKLKTKHNAVSFTCSNASIITLG